MIFNLLIGNLYAQQPTEEWVRRYPQSSTVSSIGEEIKTDSLGYIYVLADTGNGFGFIKYDPNGNLLFSTTYWPGGFDVGFGTIFEVTPNGNVFITGQVYISSNYWIYTVKFNSSGVFQWGKLFNRDNADRANDLKVNKNGDIMIAGLSGVGSTTYVLLIKYNSYGDTLWTRYFNNGQNSAVANRIFLDDLNNIFIVGRVSLPGDCLVMKYNATGNLDWFTTFISPPPGYSNIGQGIALDLNGNIYVTMTAAIPTSSLNDYLLKLTNSGVILWNKVFTGIVTGQGQNDGAPIGPVISSDGSSIYYSTMTVNGTGGGGSSIATIKYNSAGDSQWVKVYNGGGVPATANRISGIRLDKNDNIYIYMRLWFLSNNR